MKKNARFESYLEFNPRVYSGDAVVEGFLLVNVRYGVDFKIPA